MDIAGPRTAAGPSGQGVQRMAVKFRAGQQLVSAVDSTAVIVIRAPAAECTLTCGGVAMARRRRGRSPPRNPIRR